MMKPLALRFSPRRVTTTCPFTKVLEIFQAPNHAWVVEPRLLLLLCQQEETFWFDSILISKNMGLFWM